MRNRQDKRLVGTPVPICLLLTAFRARKAAGRSAGRARPVFRDQAFAFLSPLKMATHALTKVSPAKIRYPSE